jgi:hypothetical protein
MNFETNTMNQRFESGSNRIKKRLLYIAGILGLFYAGHWYFIPTGLPARLPYCIHQLLFEPLSEINGDDGRIIGMFATEPRSVPHVGIGYSVLHFYEEGAVAEYYVIQKSARFVNANRVAIWMNWYETPALTIDDVPQYTDGKGHWMENVHFFVSPPEKGVYTLQQGEVDIVWDVEQKWISDNSDERWTGVLIDDQLFITKIRPYGTFETIFYFVDYNTCPLCQYLRQK